MRIRRRHRARAFVDVERRIAELERWHEIESDGRRAGYDPSLCIAAADRGMPIVATCKRPPAPPMPLLAPGFAPGSIWPVEDANMVQVFRGYAHAMTSAPALLFTPPQAASVGDSAVGDVLHELLQRSGSPWS